MKEIIIISLVMMVASYVQSSTGFGMAIVAMAILPMILPVTDSLFLTQIIAWLVICTITIQYIKYVNYKLIIFTLLFSFVGIFIGLMLVLNFDNLIMIKILGGLLILLSIYFVFWGERFKVPANNIVASITGFVSGVLSGMVNIAGPPVVLYYSSAINDKKEYMGTLQMFFLITITYKIILFITMAGIPRALIPLIPYSLVAAALGYVLGMITYKKLPQEATKKIIYGVMTVAGFWYLIK